jgi:hypothetical protein
MAAVIKAASDAPVTAYVDTVSNQPLLARLPTAGAVASTKMNDALGITEWTLSNGVRVVLKPTTFRLGPDHFSGREPRRHVSRNDADFIPAATAADVIEAGWSCHFQLHQSRQGACRHHRAVRADIGATEEGLAGGSARRDLETMFQLIYLRFTAPRADPVAFGVLKDQLKVALANQRSMPETVFDEALSAALTQNHPRAQPLTPERLDQMDLQKSLAFYKDRFADASDFVFVFVGSFDLPTMKPLVERYLGALAVTPAYGDGARIGMHPPDAVVDRQVKSGIEPRAQVSIVFSGPFQNDESHRVVANAMADTLGGNLQRTLREDLGGTYGVSVEPNYLKRADAGVSLHDQLRVRSGASQRPRRCGLPRHRHLQDARPQPEPGRGCACRPDARLRDQQPRQPLPAEPDTLQVRIRRERGGCLQYAVVLHAGNGGGDPRRRADVSEHESLREGDVAAGYELAKFWPVSEWRNQGVPGWEGHLRVCRLATRSVNAFRLEARVTQLMADAAMGVG